VKRRITFLFILSLILISTTFVSCQQHSSKEESSQVVVSNEKKAVIPVEGMSCMSCVATVKRALSVIGGVRAVNVNLKDKNATVQYDSIKVTSELLREAINKSGYQAGKPQTIKK